MKPQFEQINRFIGTLKFVAVTTLRQSGCGLRPPVSNITLPSNHPDGVLLGQIVWIDWSQWGAGCVCQPWRWAFTLVGHAGVGVCDWARGATKAADWRILSRRNLLARSYRLADREGEKGHQLAHLHCHAIDLFVRRCLCCWPWYVMVPHYCAHFVCLLFFSQLMAIFLSMIYRTWYECSVLPFEFADFFAAEVWKLILLIIIIGNVNLFNIVLFFMVSPIISIISTTNVHWLV